MLQIILWKWSKRTNSTARPDIQAADPTQYSPSSNCRLIRGTDIEYPAFEFRFEERDFNPCVYNLCYVADFGERWYFIRNWRWENVGIWIAECEVDVLATWRDRIADSEEYILRSSHEFDTDITDGYYPAKADSDLTTVNGGTLWPAVGLSGGTYVIGVSQAQAGTMGTVQYYTLTQGQLTQLADYLNSEGFWSGIIEDAEIQLQPPYSFGSNPALFRAQIDPLQYIRSAMWFPFEDAGSGQQIMLGYWQTDVTGGALAGNAIMTFSGTVGIPAHPQSARGNYLNAQPFTQLMLDVPGFGTYPLDPITYIDVKSVTYIVEVDLLSGVGWLTIGTGGGNNATHVAQAQIGVPIALSSIANNYLATAEGIGSAIGSLGQGSISGTVSGIVDAVNSSFPQFQTTGNNGSVSGLMRNNRQVKLYVKHFRVVDDDNSHRGRPLCKKMKISTQADPSGAPTFLMIADPDILIPAPAQEIDKIKNFMAGGFYFE